MLLDGNYIGNLNMNCKCGKKAVIKTAGNTLYCVPCYKVEYKIKGKKDVNKSKSNKRNL